MSLRIISDIHGRYDTYLDLTKGTSHTLQLGDLGYDYNKISRLDPLKHKFFGGNHDCYDVYHNIPYSLGDYGKVRLNGMKFFFIRGAFSIDWQIRTVFDLAEGKKSWWANEQLNYQDMSSALKEYKRTKPSIMFTHSCPRVIGVASCKWVLPIFIISLNSFCLDFNVFNILFKDGIKDFSTNNKEDT